MKIDESAEESGRCEWTKLQILCMFALGNTQLSFWTGLCAAKVNEVTHYFAEYDGTFLIPTTTHKKENGQTSYRGNYNGPRVTRISEHLPNAKHEGFDRPTTPFFRFLSLFTTHRDSKDISTT